MKFLKVLPLVMVASLSACSRNRTNEMPLLIFDTEAYLTMRVDSHFVSHQTYDKTVDLLKELDKISDAYKSRDQVTNIYSLNQTNDRLEISKDLYDLLCKANAVKESVKYFNPLMGSLSNKWKKALHPENEEEEPRQLTDEEIQAELTKINSSSLVLESENNKYYAQRVGDALIDVGAIAKGYALDKCLSYFKQAYTVKDDYLVDLGKSSILLGINDNKPETNGCGGFNPLHGTYSVQIEDLRKVTIELRNCFISTSGVSQQGVVIDGTTYSHIVSPETGSVVNNYDAVIVVVPDTVEDGGFLSDALSTSFMMSTKEEIMAYEEKNSDISVIAIKDGNIDYMSENITLTKYNGNKIIKK